MSAFSAAADDEDGDTINALRAENTMLRQVVEQVLEAWQTSSYGQPSHHKAMLLAMTALRAALEQPVAGNPVTVPLTQEQIDAANSLVKQVEQEPVAWGTFDGEGGYDYRSYDDNESYAQEWAQRNPRHAGWVEALYTHPQPKREPLTDEQILEISFALLAEGSTMHDFARAIERAHGIRGEA